MKKNLWESFGIFTQSIISYYDNLYTIVCPYHYTKAIIVSYSNIIV